MLGVFDVHYGPTHARVACVLARAWDDAAPCDERVKQVAGVGEYEPGSFYRRELPPLLSLIGDLPPLEIVVVDGFVWLDDAGRPGLGARLHDAVGVPVVGVAKTAFRGAPALEVLRGASAKPLFVTSVGMEPEVAADHVRRMHGPFRIPTLVKRADALARGTA